MPWATFSVLFTGLLICSCFSVTFLFWFLDDDGLMLEFFGLFSLR